ncbi:translation initiation factor 2D [Kwoniella heveanensis BCC8398]|uniref:Translation initiation factor 2D n=1 Tax=Kwoniella heveanensis BCC8398 TaxID=1296120 RepID=A0A1B9GLI6_9TREE|nr:translation initiation factor 2D [Kwoniella heveanensis BCC8398]
MFKKPLAHQSNATPLRSSARRQLLSSIFAQYPCLLGPGPARSHQKQQQQQQQRATGSNETQTEENNGGENGDNGGLNEKELGKVILPEGVRSASFETSAEIVGTFWLTPDGDPLWMTFGRNSKEYIPTLYLLSLPLPYAPLPILQLHHPVPPPILTGAPLFIPAVRNLSKPHLLPDLKEGDLVAFVTSSNNQIEDVRYIGVGRITAKGGMEGALERRIENLKEGGEREEGKFCDIMCIVDDHLWDLGSKPALPAFRLPLPQKALAAPPTDSTAQAQPSQPGPSRAPSPPAVETLSLTESNTAPLSSSASGAATAEQVPVPTISSLSSSEISTLLSIALLQSLKSLQPSSFPMPASLLYSNYVLPSRPAYIPKENREEVVIGKSDWKKLAKWMKEVSKQGLLKTKETKGEVVVQSFDSKHPALQNHAEFTTIAEVEAKEARKAARAAVTAEQNGSSGAGKAKEIVVEEVWKPASGALTFWEACGIDNSTFHPPSALKASLDAYVTKNKLILPDHRSIVLDEELGRAVGIKKPEPGMAMARDRVLAKLKASVNWSVSVGGVMKKGSLQPITMSVKTRQGRKTVTHVSGLETFSVDIDSFAEEMRKACAGSASVQPLPGASPKLNLQEIMIQGNQIKAVTEALLARGVPKRWIKEGEDSVKQRKK